MKYIVSDEHKFIYFVVPKVACSSIKTALLPLFDINTTGYEIVLEDEAPDTDAHEPPNVSGYQVHELYDESGSQINENRLIRELNGEYREYFKFAFVRNPWDRLVSCYFDKIVGVEETDSGKPALRPPGRKDSRLYTGMTFAEFVEGVHETPDSEANAHFRSQYKVICGPRGDEPIMADFVGRFENLAADFDAVAERIGGAHRLQLPHLHRFGVRKSRPYTDLYDDRLKDLVHERYREDVEIFGYSFGDTRTPPPIRRNGLLAASRRPEQNVERLKEQNRIAEQDAQRLKEHNRILEQDAQRLKEQNRILEQDAQRLKQDAESLEKRNRTLEQDAERLKERSRNLEQNAQRLKERNRNLERRLQDMRSSKSWQLLNGVNQFKKKFSRSSDK